MKHNDLSDLISHFSLWRLWNVVTKLVVTSVVLFDVVFLQVRDGIFVVHSHEWLFWRHKVWMKIVHVLASWRLEKPVDDVDEQVFNAIQKLLKSDKGAFGFDVSVFRQVPTSATLFRSEKYVKRSRFETSF